MRSIGYLFLEGVRSLWKNRTMSIASIVVLTSCLLLTGIAVLLTMNMDSIMKELEGSNTITVFLNEDTPKLRSIQIGEQIRSVDNVGKCEFIAGEDALKDVMEGLGDDGDLFAGFDNFMPDVYNMKIENIDLYDQTIESVLAIDGVMKCSDNSDVVDKLSNLDVLIRYGSIAIIAILAVVALFIIANTLKVAMFSRRVEINIMKSVGATNMFIRIPFIVEGILIGAISGAISASVLYFSYDQLSGVVSSVVTFIHVFDIQPYSRLIFLTFILVGIAFGLTGGVISIGRYLKREGENAII